jgi:hypothetical protein
MLHANRVAEHMLDKGGPIQRLQGVLQATASSATSELRSALALAARNEAGTGKTGLAIGLTEPDVPPVSVTSCRSLEAISARGCKPVAVAAVFIGAPPDVQEGADAVAAAFGSSPSDVIQPPVVSLPQWEELGLPLALPVASSPLSPALRGQAAVTAVAV